MERRRIAACLMVLLCVLVARAQETPRLAPNDPAALLGRGLAELVAAYGLPQTVYALRGAEPWQDDVVFSYAAGYSFFIFGDKLWQLRFATPYTGPVYGIFLGDSEDKACSLLGEAYERADESLVYRLPYKGYPVRLKLSLRNGAISDIYLYRDDF